MYKKCDVPLQHLKKQINLKRYKFETTNDIKPLASVIGQERAVSSITFALEIDGTGYNIFVTGSYGTGRTTIVSDLLKKEASKHQSPDDLMFVYNFSNPDEPLALSLPAGKASKLKRNLQRLITSLKSDLQKAFESKSYATRKNETIEAIQIKKQDTYSALEQEALAMDIQIKSSSTGFVTIPLQDGKAIESDNFQNLPSQEQDKITKNLNHVQKRIQEVVRELNFLERNLADQLDKLNEGVASFVVNNHFGPLIEHYTDYPDVKDFLNRAAEDIIDNVAEFIGKRDENENNNSNHELPYRLNKYKINVIIDNAKQLGAAVVYETNPTYGNLFGRVEKKSFQGFVYTDFTMIKAGSLLSANGGYLIIDADQLVKHSFGYESLKRALRSRQVRIEDIHSLYGGSPATSLRPAAIPINLKVVLIGQASLYRMLHNHDEEFRKIFKVRADFDVEVKESSDSIKKYLQFIARVVLEEKLLPFDKKAVSAVIEYGYRLADHQKKLSIRFGELVKIIREASFWTKKSNRKIVTARDVGHAIENKIYRHDLVEEKVQDSINEKTINVDTEGFVVGQINGLAVYNLGDYAFGRPSRITINTFIGSRGIINIEREAKMSGRVHDKGMLVLNGYFSQKFGTSMPLSFSASITFEQNYGTIDGDSASSTELYGLLSSLSGIPIDQGIAVTGSVNQKGEVQAIGGVNQKIEGFFKVCVSRGLTGKQGVIIPRANIKNLLLNDDVYQAVSDKKFNIWAVDNIEDGMRILTGVKCGIKHKDGSYTNGSVFNKVREKLIEFARSAHQFRKSLGEPEKKEGKENSEG